LEGDQLDQFIQEKFRSVCKAEKVNKKGETEFVLDWSHDGVSLCRQSFAKLFNISKHKLDKCSSSIKSSGTKYLTSISHRTWKDAHVHDFTFADTEELFKMNLKQPIIGKYTIPF
jgi:hypothetical protein